MPHSPLGLQLWSLRREFDADAAGTLRRVRSLGFDLIETAGTYGWTVERWKELLAETGLTLMGAHIGNLFEDLASHIAFQSALGNPRYVLPSLDEKDQTVEGYRRTAMRLNQAGEALRPYGATVLYHNHEFEFKVLAGGLTGYDLLLRETDPALVRFEVDTYWVAYAGREPQRFLVDHAERVGAVHAKQIRLADKAEVGIGEGDIDFAAILALARANKWPVVLEYEGENAVETARRGAAFLAGL